MEYTKIIDTEWNGEPKILALTAPILKFTKSPANTIQIQIEQDDQDAYIDLWLSEAILLQEFLDKWIFSKHSFNVLKIIEKNNLESEWFSELEGVEQKVLEYLELKGFLRSKTTGSIDLPPKKFFKIDVNSIEVKGETKL